MSGNIWEELDIPLHSGLLSDRYELFDSHKTKPIENACQEETDVASLASWLSTAAKSWRRPSNIPGGSHQLPIPDQVPKTTFSCASISDKRECTIRCDIECVDTDLLSEDFKADNAVFPSSHEPNFSCKTDDEASSHSKFKAAANKVGWALAYLNPDLRGQRRLLQRAVDSWRQSSSDTLLEKALPYVWSKTTEIGYVPNSDEFAILNHFRDRLHENDRFKYAVQRYHMARATEKVEKMAVRSLPSSLFRIPQIQEQNIEYADLTDKCLKREDMGSQNQAVFKAGDLQRIPSHDYMDGCQSTEVQRSSSYVFTPPLGLQTLDTNATDGTNTGTSIDAEHIGTHIPLKEDPLANKGDAASCTDLSLSPTRWQKEEQRRMTTSPRSKPSSFIWSSSQSSSSARSESTETDIAETILSSETAQFILRGLLRFFEHFIESKLAIGDIQKCGEHYPSAGSSSGTYLTTQESSGTGGGRDKGKKRARESGYAPDETGEGPNEEETDPKRTKIDCLEKPKIACPYMKNCPAEFSTWRTCVGPGFGDMHRMKEHLKRRHYKEHVCQRCGSAFADKRGLQGHARLTVPCQLQEVQLEKGFITQVQWDDINRRRQGHRTSVQERWREIYLILFPETDQESIPSPYFDQAETTDQLATVFDPSELESFMKKHLPGRVLLKLTQEFEIMSQQAKEKLADIVQRVSIEVLHNYVAEKSGDGPEQPLTSLPYIEGIDDDLVNSFDMFLGGNQFDYDVPFVGGEGWQFSKVQEPGPTDSAYSSLP